MKKNYIFLIMLLLSCFHLVTAQELIDYQFQTQTGATYTSIASSGTQLGCTNDDSQASLAWPFSFNYGGTVYAAGDLMYVVSNGYVALDTSVTSTQPTSSLTGIVSPLGHDLNPNSSYYTTTITGGKRAYYAVTGSAPNRVLTIEWFDMPSYSTPYNVYNFEVKFYETTNVIEFCYGSQTINTGKSPYVLMRHHATNQCIAVRNPVGSNDWSTFVLQEVASASGNTLSLSLESYPQNLVYRFTPTVASCAKVNNIQLLQPTTSSMVVKWDTVGDASSSWQVSYHPVDDTDNVNTVTVNTTTATINGLQSNTVYYVEVRAVCQDGTLSLPRVTTGITLPVNAATLPYNCDFEDASENANWTFYNGDAANQWMIGNATDIGGTQSLYISNDGQHNAYYFDSASVVYAVRDVYFDPNYEYYTVNFKYKAEGLQNTDYLRLYIGRTPSFVSPNNTGTLQAPADAIYMTMDGSGSLGQTPDWRDVVLTLDTAWRGRTARFYLTWVNNSMNGLNPPAAIDQIHVTGHNCARPYNVHYSYPDETSMTLTWSDSTGASGYEVALLPFYGGDAETAAVSVTDTSYTFTNLESNTPHRFYLRSVCGSEKSGWATYNLGVHCANISTVPYEEHFDVYGTGTTAKPTCWSTLTNNTTTSYPYINSTYRASGAGSLQFYGTTSYYSYAVMPQIDVNSLTLSDLMLSFKGYIASTTSTYGVFDVGVMTDPADISTFTTVKSFTHADYAAVSTWTNFNVYFNNYMGTGTYIAIRVPASGTNNVYIDDVVLKTVPTCGEPTGIQISQLSSEGFTVSWSAVNPASTYEVAVVTPAGADIETATPFTVTGMSTVITGLDAQTSYQVFVRTICGTEAGEWSSPVAVRTLCNPTPDIPYTADFEGLGTGSGVFPECWLHGNCGSSATYPYISSSYAHSGSGALYFYSYSASTALTSSQALDLTSNTEALEMSFWLLKTSGYYGRMDVGYMTDPTDMNTFVVLKQIYPGDLASTTTWYKITALIPEEANGQVIYPSFFCPITIGGASNYVYFDDLTIDVADISSSCPAPAHLTVSSVHGNSALLTWTASPDVTEFAVEWSEAGLENYQMQTVSGTQFMLEGLSELTEYDVMVYTVCDGISSDTLTATFRTSCLAGGSRIVGTEAVEQHQFPINTFYNHSYTQQLYTASELGGGGDIHTIGFQYFHNTAQTKSNFSIYLAETDLTTLTEWVPADSFHLVYSGTVTFSNTNPDYWVDITLDSLFQYSGNRNLLVAVLNNHGSYSTSSDHTFYGHSISGMSRYYNVDGATQITPLPTTSNAGSQRSNIRFGMNCDSNVVCAAPNMYVESFTAENVTVAWVPGLSENAWELEYKAAGDADWTSEGVVTASPYVIENLTSGETYKIRIRSNCGSDSSDWSLVTVNLPCFINIPYDESFENTTGSGASHMVDCWTRGTNNTSQYPYTSSSQALSGTYSLYFYGTSAYYCYAAAPRFADDVVLDSLQIRFNMYYSTASYGIEVGFMTDPDDYSTFEPIDMLVVGTASQWVEKELNTAGYTGNGRYLAFRIPQWYTSYMYIDDLHVGYMTSCVHVTNMEVQNITTNSATVNWIPGADEMEWEYAYGLAGTVNLSDADIYTTQTNSVQLSDLSDNSTYDVYVRSSCDGGLTSDWMMVSFTTNCLPISTLPYAMNFDNYTHTSNVISGTNNIPNCWEVNNVGTSYTAYPYVYYSTSYGHSGNYALRFYTYNSSSYADQYAFLPEMDVNTLNMSDLLLEFYMRAESSSYAFDVVVGVTEGTSISTFVPVDTISVSSTSYVYKSVYLTNYQGNGNRLALKVPKPTDSYNYGYIDDISIASGTCVRPENLTSTAHDATSVTLQWTEMGTATDWVIEYGASGFELGTGTQVQANTNPFTVTDLDNGTQYEFYLYADCGGGDVSPWILNSLTVSTDMIAVDLPYSTDFETGSDIAWMLVENDAPCKWRIGTHGGSNGQLYLSNSNTSVSYTVTTVASALAQKMFNMGTEDSVCVSFDITCGGESSYDYVKVLLVPNTVNIPVGATNVRTIEGHLGNYQSGIYALDFSPYASQSTGSVSTYNYIYNLTTGTVHVEGKLLNPAPGHEAYLVVLWNNDGSAGNSVGATIDNLSVRMDSTSVHACTRPFLLTASNVTENSADLTWETSASSCTLYYGIAGTDMYDSVLNATSPYSLTGLSSSSNYEWYVVGVCSDGEALESQPASFTTLCGAITIPYVMGFEGLSTGNSAFPNCWSRSNTYSTSEYPYVSSSYPSSGSRSLYFYNSSSSYNLAVLPSVDVTLNPLNTLQVSFSMRSSNTSQHMVVGVMTDPDNISTFVPVDTVTNTAGSQHELFEVPLGQYAGTGSYIALYAYCTVSGNIYMDDVVVDLIPSCPKPANLTASNATTSSISVSWTSNGSETSWNIEYGPAGFTHGDATATTVHCTTNPYTIQNLQPSMVYDIYVQADCDGGDLSNWSNVLSANTACSSVMALPYTENFDAYGTGEGAYPNCWEKINTYSYNRPYVHSTHYEGVGSLYFYTATQGTYNIAITPEFDGSINISSLKANFMYRAVNSTDRLVVGVMTDNTNASTFVPVDTIAPSSPASTWVAKEVSFANYTGSGHYIAFRNSYTTTNTYTYIDNLVISLDSTYVPACVEPTGLAVSAITQTSATVAWTAGGDETAWNVQYKEASASSWSSPVPVNTPTYNLTGLTPNTPYQVRVQANCGNGETSAWTSSVSFTTLQQGPEPCDVPTGVAASNITAEGATITWDANAGVDSWNIQYRPQNGQLTSATSNTNSYTITGLTASTTYDVQVQAVCDGNNTSAWSANYTFTTTTGLANRLENSVVLFPNPAKEYVDIRIDGDLNVIATEVYDVYGKLVMTADATNRVSTMRMNVSGLADGMYFVRVTTEQGTVTKSFVKK